MLWKFCRCGVKIPIEKKVCEKCEEKINRQTKARYKHYKSKRTDVKEQKFYSSRDWKITKEIVKRRDKGLCLLCLKKEKISYTDVVHHIQPLKDEWSMRLSTVNLVCLCDACHKVVHGEYDRGKGHKEKMQSELRDLISES